MQFTKDTGEMVLDRLFADEKRLGDITVRTAAGNASNDFHLPSGEMQRPGILPEFRRPFFQIRILTSAAKNALGQFGINKHIAPGHHATPFPDPESSG